MTGYSIVYCANDCGNYGSKNEIDWDDVDGKLTCPNCVEDMELVREANEAAQLTHNLVYPTERPTGAKHEDGAP